jgi:hypothetical protein
MKFMPILYRNIWRCWGTEYLESPTQYARLNIVRAARSTPAKRNAAPLVRLAE